MLNRLAFGFLLLSAAAAQAQPAVPAVPPLRSTPAARPAAQAPAAARPAPAPVADPDAPPTSDAAGAAQAAAPVSAADAPPTSDAPTSAPGPTASAAPNAAPTSDGAAAVPALPATVTKNFPLTPEGNAAFLAAYAARPDVKKLDNGVLYRVLRAAEAKSNGPISRGDVVTVTYRGWLIDGKLFDETKPATPVLFSLNAVVPGWRTAMLKMKVGDLWEIVLPSEQAYGADGRPGRIPPNQTLVFVVSMAKVEYAG